MGKATRLLLFVVTTAVLVGVPIARAAEEVDLLLVLSSDVSRSIDAPNFKLQRDGYAAAIVNSRVIQAIRSGALTRLRLRPTRCISWRGWCKWTPVEPAGTCPGYKSSKLDGSEDPWTTGARDEHTAIGGGSLA
jgi:hypothetical protein